MGFYDHINNHKTDYKNITSDLVRGAILLFNLHVDIL